MILLWRWLAVSVCGMQMSAVAEARGLHRHDSVGVPGGECAHVGQDQVAGAVLAELFFVLFLDYGERAEHIFGVVAVQAVEVEVEGVQPGPQVPPLLLTPQLCLIRIDESC